MVYGNAEYEYGTLNLQTQISFNFAYERCKFAKDQNQFLERTRLNMLFSPTLPAKVV